MLVMSNVSLQVRIQTFTQRAFYHETHEQVDMKKDLEDPTFFSLGRLLIIIATKSIDCKFWQCETGWIDRQ